MTSNRLAATVIALATVLAAGAQPAAAARHDMRHPSHHERHRAPALAGTAAPSRPGDGQIYQENAYTFRIGPDGKRWYEPTPCSCGPQ